MLVVIVHIVLSTLLFYLLNWVGSHARNYGYMQLSLVLRTDEAPAFNFVLKTFAPIVYITLIAALCYKLSLSEYVNSVWLIVLYYWVLRISYNIVLGRTRLLNWGALIPQIVISIVSAIGVYRFIILPRVPLFPSAQEIGSQLWVIIALFLYATFNNVRLQPAGAEHRKIGYIRKKYVYLHKQYNDVIEKLPGPEELKHIAYAILIHENFNRPVIVRFIEKIVGPKFVKTSGIMQIRANKILNDRDSVQMGIDRIIKQYSGLTPLEQKQYYFYSEAVIKEFNQDDQYISEVKSIVSYLDRRVYK